MRVRSRFTIRITVATSVSSSPTCRERHLHVTKIWRCSTEPAVNEIHSNRNNAESPKTNAELRVATQLVSAILTDIDTRHTAGGVQTPFSEMLNVSVYNIALASVQTWRPSLDKSQWKDFSKNPSFKVIVGLGENSVEDANGTVDLLLSFTAGDPARYPEVREDELWIGQTLEEYKDLFPNLQDISAATTKPRRGKHRHQGH